MGFLDSFKAFCGEVRDVVLGVDRLAELRRRKRAASRRRYRANRRLRALGSLPAANSLEPTQAEGVTAVVSDGLNSNRSDNSSVVAGGGDAIPPIELEDGGDVSQTGDGEDISDFAEVEEEEEETAEESFSLSCPSGDGEDAALDFDFEPTDSGVQSEEQGGEGAFGSEKVDAYSDKDDSTIFSSNGDIQVGNDLLGGFSNNRPDDVLVPVPANNSGLVGPVGAPPSLAHWRIPRRSSPRLSPGLEILGEIPKETSSDDNIWTDGKIPDLMGLVVEADELGKIFVVPRSFYGIQVYTARHLSYPHTVIDLPTELPGYFQQLQEPRRVVWYAPNQDDSDEFFVVLNLPSSVYRAIGKQYPFQGIADYTSSHQNEEMDQAERQRAKLNRGWTGTRSMPTRDANGHPMPSIKEGSSDPVIVRTLQMASNYIRTLPVLWNGNRPLQVPSERTRQFAGKLGDGILFEGVTHTSHQRCGWHRDVQNPGPQEQTVSHVTCINKQLDNGGYIVSIFYFRLSVSVNLRMNVTGDPILRHFVEKFLCFPPERRSFSTASIGPGTGFCAIAPNLDPISFHSLADICIISLADRFRLSLYETISLVVCFLYMPNTTEPFARAAVRILQDGRMGRNTYGHRVGFMVARWMVQEQRSFNVRFNIYRGDPVLDEQLFESHTTSLFWLVVHVWSAYPSRPANTIVAKAYTCIRDLLKSLFRGVGNLIAMHTIQMLAEIGLLPQWLQTYACFDHTGRVFKWYAAKFSVPATAVQARRMMASLPTGMERFLAVWVNESLLENLACKNFQREGGGAECRRDVHHHKAPIITRTTDGRGLRILLSTGDEIKLLHNCAIPSWSFGDERRSMLDIADYLELPKALPGLRSLRSSRLPDEARASPATSNVPFDLPRWFS